MTFDEMCEFEVLYNAFLAARRGKRSKYSAAQYEANVLQLTERLFLYSQNPKVCTEEIRGFLCTRTETPSGASSGVC